MDLIDLDIAENIEEHYIKDRELTRSHLDCLHDNYIAAGKLAKKIKKRGLCLLLEHGSQTKLFFLNIGTEDGRRLKEDGSRGILDGNARANRPTLSLGFFGFSG